MVSAYLLGLGLSSSRKIQWLMFCLATIKTKLLDNSETFERLSFHCIRMYIIYLTTPVKFRLGKNDFEKLTEAQSSWTRQRSENPVKSLYVV